MHDMQERADRPSPSGSLMNDIIEAFGRDLGPLTLNPGLPSSEDKKWSTSSAAPRAPSDGRGAALTPPDLHETDDVAPSRPHALQADTSQEPSASVRPDEHPLSAVQQEQVLQLRDHLVDLFERSDRQRTWHPLLKDIADTFNLLYGQLIDPSTLLNALPSMQRELQALPPTRDDAQLARVRRRFLKMGEYVFPYLEEKHLPRWCPPRPSWHLPPLARKNPRHFWAKVWDSFDFSSPQFIDTTLSRTEQHPDVVVYIYALGSWLDTDLETLQHSFGTLKENWPYELGRDFLRDALQFNHGINLRQKGHDRAVPFPWLDSELKRLKSLGWSFEQQYDEAHWRDIWIVDYHDLNVGDPMQPPVDPENHFIPFSYKDVLLTNIRVPLPRQLLARPDFLNTAVADFYTDAHPLQMLGEARTLTAELGGNVDSDDDVRAGMLYIVISHLARYSSAIWDMILGDG